jgi:Uma2 family endonuclease
MGSVARLPRKWTYSELERLPEDGPQYELYDGELWEMPSPTVYHQRCASRCYLLLLAYARETGGEAFYAPLDIVFSEHDVAQPDVMFFSAARKNLVNLNPRPRHAPDIAVEVLSPSTEHNDRGKKLEMFVRHGVPEYWLVDPSERTVEIRSLRDGDYTLALTVGYGETFTSPRFSDLTCEASFLFPDPDAP